MPTLKKMCGFYLKNFFEKFFACWLFSATGILLFSKGDIALDTTDVTGTLLLFFISFIVVLCQICCPVFPETPKCDVHTVNLKRRRYEQFKAH